MKKEAEAYAATSESIDVIVEASYGKCAKWESEFKTVFQQLTIDGKQGFAPSYVDQAVSDARRQLREQAVAAILDARMKSQKSAAAKR